MAASASRGSSAPSLRSAGLRQTPQREAILRVLAESDRPLSVEEIWARMAEQRSGIPTIYRNLERFVAEGWVETIQGADQTMRFVRCHSRFHHHHLQCEDCGRTVEVDSCGLDLVLGDYERSTGFHITKHQLQVFGRCPECRRRIGVDTDSGDATI